MRGQSPYFVLYDEIDDFKVDRHPCQQEYVDMDINGGLHYEYCGDCTIGYFDSHGWVCKLHAQELGLIDYTDY